MMIIAIIVNEKSNQNISLGPLNTDTPLVQVIRVNPTPLPSHSLQIKSMNECGDFLFLFFFCFLINSGIFANSKVNSYCIILVVLHLRVHNVHIPCHNIYLYPILHSRHQLLSFKNKPQRLKLINTVNNNSQRNQYKWVHFMFLDSGKTNEYCY